MNRRAWVYGVVCVVAVWLAGACTRQRRPAPAPDARRPQLKTEAELAAERAQRIQDGSVVPSSAPALPVADRRPVAARRRLPMPIIPSPGAIEAEILLVNQQQLTAAEVLYPLRRRLAQAHRTQTKRGFQEQAARMIARQTQQEIGRLLVYAEALAELEDTQTEALDQAVERELKRQVAREFGGSTARLAKQLERYGLTVDQYRDRLKRMMVVSQYTREKLLPQASVTREMLLAAYRDNLSRYSSPPTRELLIIEAPFASFLPQQTTWQTASEQARARARLEAVRQIRKAYAALKDKPFAEVAREYSRGVQATDGGSWGQIGQPLQPPYDTVSKLIFDFQAGQYSEPLETETGWYIVKCGEIRPAQRRSFSEVQEELRQQLMNDQLNRLSARYIIGLADKATISSLDQFVMAAVRRAETEPWTQLPEQTENPLSP